MKPITFERIKGFVDRHYNRLWMFAYKCYIPYAAKKIRRKESIKVLFVINELPTWKTESLYIAMLNHPRVKPILGLTLSLDYPHMKEELKKYVETKGYEYTDLDILAYNPIKDIISPDIIFYEKPYSECYHHRHTYSNHLNTLFCYANYAFNILDEEWAIGLPLIKTSWQVYYENEFSAYHRKTKVGKNAIIAGIPMQDLLIQKRKYHIDTWKYSPNTRKRIIYAPHHTIGDLHSKGIANSTFLEYGEFMLDLAKRYSDRIEIAFKPHPGLYKKLEFVWGLTKTDAYYTEWAQLENAQVVTGDYVDLFMSSDAMIHDCSSFTVEYLYTGKPVMFLQREANHADNLTELAKKAFEQHYLAKNKTDIEAFVENVIRGIDNRKEERDFFYQKYLLPPNGKTACENIINSILGQ